MHVYEIYRVWFGWVWWHINHCWLFNAKSFLHIHIRYIGFGLVGFYGISTITGHLMPNPVYYIIIIHMISEHILLITFLNEPEVIFFHIVKWFQVLLCNTNYSLQHYSFICSQLNGSKYSYVSLTIQLIINHLLTNSLLIKQFYFKQFNLA